MPWPSRKRITAKTTTNRNCPIPKEGGSRPAGVGVFKEVVISTASPLGQSFSIFIVYCRKRRLYHFEHIRISEQADQSTNQPARCHGIRAVGACGEGSDSSSRSAIS